MNNDDTHIALKKEEVKRAFKGYSPKEFPVGLELGAGNGYQSTLLKKYVLNLTSTEIDDERLIERDKEIKYMILDAHNLENKFPPNTFDIIYSSNMLEHVENPERVLKGIKKTLKDDGVTIHIMPSPFWKLCNLLLHPFSVSKNIFSMLINRSKTPKSNKEMEKVKIEDNRHPLKRFLIPRPHGVSSSNIKEFKVFSKKEWKVKFEKAGFKPIKIIDGPVTTAHTHSIVISKLLEKLGFSSVYIYVLKKKKTKTLVRF